MEIRCFTVGLFGKQLLIDSQVGIVKIEVGEDPVFLKHIVGKNQPLEQVHLRDLSLLLEPRKQKIHLNLKLGARPFLVKRAEKGI